MRGDGYGRDFGPGDTVSVYDADADEWFDGVVETEDTLNGRDYWVVRLDDGPIQHGRQVDVMAVPLDRRDLIEGR